MTENEAIKEFQQNIDMPFGSNISREASELAIQALKKQITKNPYHISQVDYNDNANVECPACHATTDYAVNVIKRGHCWKCGQLLDWSDEE